MDWESKDDIGNLLAVIRESVREASQTTTISQQQIGSLKSPATKGKIWVAKFSLLPSPEDQARQSLLRVIDKFNEQNVPYFRPLSTKIDLEWVGFRKGVGKDTPELKIPEKEKYRGLLEDSPGPGVVMILYGGAFYMNTQASYRKIAAQLSETTGLPCVTVHQRLSPQNSFPTALLDVFNGYMALLSPPPGSPHAPIAAASIVIAGDSSGACLAMSMLQVLLELKRTGITSIPFHGRNVDISLPAGFTILSGVADLTNGLPSYRDNASIDVFPAGMPPASTPDFPPCKIWPSTPPRGNIYCESELMCHPITAPAMAKDWTGSPPLWFASGQEQIVDGVKIVAKTACIQEVPVFFQEYEAMPHCFMWILSASPQARKCLHDWAEACKTLVGGGVFTPGAQLVCVKGLEILPGKVKDLTKLTGQEARQIIMGASQKFSDFTGRRGVGTKL